MGRGGVQVSVRDVSAECSMLVIAGPGSGDVLGRLGVPTKLLEGAPASHGLLDVGGRPVLLVTGSGLHHKGYTLIADDGNAGDLWKALTDKVAHMHAGRVWRLVACAGSCDGGCWMLHLFGLHWALRCVARLPDGTALSFQPNCNKSHPETAPGMPAACLAAIDVDQIAGSFGM